MGTVKWVVTEEGLIQIVPYSVGGVEIYHTVASDGKPVLAAGEAEIAGEKGNYFGLSINNHSGHYLPTTKSLDIALEKFADAGITLAEESIQRVEWKRWQNNRLQRHCKNLYSSRLLRLERLFCTRGQAKKSIGGWG